MKYLIDNSIMDGVLDRSSPVHVKLQSHLARGDDVKIGGLVYYEKKRDLKYADMNDKLKTLEEIIEGLGGVTLFDMASMIY